MVDVQKRKNGHFDYYIRELENLGEKNGLFAFHILLIPHR